MTEDTHDNTMVLLLGRIDGKLDAALARIERMESSLGSAEERIGALEKGRAWLLGAASVVSAIITFIFSGGYPTSGAH